jgi:two-component system response regulator DevR
LPAPIKVLIVEHDRILFEGLVSILGDQEGLEVLGVASSAADAVDKSMHLRPDLVLTGVRFPDGDGAQICERIRSRLPNTAVLFLSADASQATIEHAVMAGAAGYVSTEISVAELVDDIKRLADGELLVTASTIARMLRQGEIQPTDPDAPFAPELTARELEIVNLLASGRDNIAIAAELEIEPATVRGNVRSLLEKLGGHSKAQAVDSARRMGLVDDPAGAPR